MTTGLHRSRTDRMVAGVCGGLGHYLRIDPVIVRLFFVLLTLGNGLGVLAYLLLWIIVPYEGEKVAGVSHSGAREIAERAQAMSNELRSSVRAPHPQTSLIIGATLIILGIAFLLQNVLESLNIIWLRWLTFDTLWPLLLIVGGIVWLWRRARED